jgi:phenylpropionate dioxygenase-like ring-hydroxylating dioxygenase large terminal subunit
MACNHQGADLSLGKIVDNIVTCPRHGRKYNLDTGECLDSDFPRLKEHNVAIVGDAVYVSVSPRSDTPAGGRTRIHRPPFSAPVVNGKPTSR